MIPEQLKEKEQQKYRRLEESDVSVVPFIGGKTNANAHATRTKPR